MSTLVVGLGEPLAGDDAVGLRVVERLREQGLAGGARLVTSRDPSELTTLLPGARHALVVDAVLDEAHAGDARLVEPAELRAAAHPLSSHGVDLFTALELARTLAGRGPFPAVQVLALSIARPTALAEGLSAAGAAAVDRGVRAVRAWLGGLPDA